MLYLASTIAFGGIVAVLLLAIDPYDTGRFALFPSAGVPDFSQRLAAASLARRVEFDTAIIGNSTVQLLDPARLGKASGRRVVSLTMAGSGPLEQLAVARWFLRHHPSKSLRGLIFGIDRSWCQAAGHVTLAHPFPFWLYSDSAVEYAVHLIQYRTIDAAIRKLKLQLGRVRAKRADGYDDYEAGRVWEAGEARQQSAEMIALLKDDIAAGDFASLEPFRRFLAQLPPETMVVLVFPPRHHAGNGGASAARLAACTRAYAKLAAARPRTRVLDFLARDDIASRDENFWDLIHYRAPVARMIEADIAAILRDDTRNP